jgi:hypothetical protein
MSELTILYDGWPLARQPNSPAALHLVELLQLLPTDVRAIVALPGLPADPLPAQIETHQLDMPDNPSARLKWEQRSLPGLARELNAQGIHLTSGNPALFTSTPSILSPTGFAANPLASKDSDLRRSMASRLREALGQGGRVRASGILWPEDLPALRSNVPLMSIPPVVHPAFSKSQPGSKDDISSLDLPETYVLYHGPYKLSDLQRLLRAWTWAAGAIGEYYPLLLVGMGKSGRENLELLQDVYELGKTVRPLPEIPHSGLVWLYQNSSALFHPAPISPWGSPVRMALACGKPVVALESPLADALVGPAAYLVPVSESEANCNRALGAALLTVVVEESVANALSETACQRVDSWHSADFTTALLTAYQQIILT